MIAGMTDSPSRPLAGRHVVVTRPAQQAGPLAAALEAAGGIPVRFPVLAIHEVDAAERETLRVVLARLAASAFDLAVFVSPNAIEKTFAELRGLGLAWPQPLRVAALGKGSERALAAQGVANVISPRQRFDSEGLLELPELQAMTGKRVIIFRGDGGRELIAGTLRARGATVEYATCYRRAAPDGDTAELLTLWREGRLDAFTITSSEGLRHLHALLGEEGRALLEGTPLFAPHARIVAEARRLGLHRVVATGPGDAGLLHALSEYFSSSKVVKSVECPEHGDHGH